MTHAPTLAAPTQGNAPGLMVYVDSDLRVRFANRYCLDLLGHAPEDVVDRCLADLVDPRTLKYALAHVAELENGNAIARDYVLLCRNGERRRFRIQVVPDRDGEGRSVGYIARSSDHAGERHLKGVHTLLQATLDKYLTAGSRLSERSKLDHARRELVTTANHELLTPLASVIAALEMLRDDAGTAAGPATAGCLPIALDNAERLASVVAQWLDVERIGLGITPVRRDPLDLGELARRVVSACRQPASERGVRLETRTVALLVAGDPEKLHHVVHELVDRAIRRSPAGAVVGVTIERGDGSAILRIEDSAVANDSGDGLGLALSKVIAGRLGGTLRRLDRGGSGGAFELALPLDACGTIDA